MVLWEHVICGAQFGEKVGYTLDDTMWGTKSYGGKTILEGDLTLEDTME